MSHPNTPIRWTVGCQVRVPGGQIHSFLCKTQFDWLKISFQKMGCQKLNSTNVEEKIMSTYQSTIIWERIVWSLVAKFVYIKPKWGLKFGYTRTLYLKKGIQCMHRWGLPFSQALLTNEHYNKTWKILKFVKLLKFKSESGFQIWRRSSFVNYSQSHELWMRYVKCLCM